MANFSMSQIVGKTLTASRRVGVYKSIYDAKPIRIVEAGNEIGRVYSYVKKKSSGALWIMFDGPFYVPVVQLAGAVNVPDLAAQGAKTIEQEKKEKRDQELANLRPVEYYLKKYGVPAFGLLLLAVVLKNKTR